MDDTRRREDQFVIAHTMRERGKTIAEIAKTLELDRKQIYRFLEITPRPDLRDSIEVLHRRMGLSCAPEDVCPPPAPPSPEDLPLEERILPWSELQKKFPDVII
jgi:DNA-binding phage protein